MGRGCARTFPDEIPADRGSASCTSEANNAMRFVGRIEEWRDDRGFGFVTPNGGGARAFAHIKAFESKGRRPLVGDLISYEAVADDRRRLNALRICSQIGRRRFPGGRRGRKLYGQSAFTTGTDLYGHEPHHVFRLLARQGGGPREPLAHSGKFVAYTRASRRLARSPDCSRQLSPQDPQAVIPDRFLAGARDQRFCCRMACANGEDRRCQ